MFMTYTLYTYIQACHFLLTYREAQSKVITLCGKYREQASFGETALSVGHQKCEYTHKKEHRHFCHQNTKEKRPDYIPKVQQHHVFEQQSWKSELGHKAAQSFGLCRWDDVCTACDISAENYPKTLKQGWEEFVNGHAGWDGRGVRSIPAADDGSINRQVIHPEFDYRPVIAMWNGKQL